MATSNCLPCLISLGAVRFLPQFCLICRNVNQTRVEPETRAPSRTTTTWLRSRLVYSYATRRVTRNAGLILPARLSRHYILTKSISAHQNSHPFKNSRGKEQGERYQGVVVGYFMPIHTKCRHGVWGTEGDKTTAAAAAAAACSKLL